MQRPIVVITGPPGVGKTTLVCCLVEKLRMKTVAVSGFYTEEVRKNGERTGFDIVSLSGQRDALAQIERGNADGRRKPMVGCYAVNIDSFEAMSLPLLKHPPGSGGVLVIDEVGRMELLSKSFAGAVSELLESSAATLLVTVPAAGRGRPIPIVERIRTHPRATVVTLSRSNRDDPGLLERLLAALTPRRP